MRIHLSLLAVAMILGIGLGLSGCQDGEMHDANPNSPPQQEFGPYNDQYDDLRLPEDMDRPQLEDEQPVIYFI